MENIQAKRWSQSIPMRTHATAKNCRLCMLNDDCLLEIFEFLPVTDLLQVSDVSICFKNLIRDHIIPSRKVEFSLLGNIWSTNKILGTFGKKMRRIDIGKESTFNSFECLLVLITRYCEPNQLTELSLCYRDTKCKAHILQRAVPYFTKLEKLMLYVDTNSLSFTNFMNRLCAAPSFSPRALTLYNVKLNRSWSTSQALQNLEEIRLDYIVCSCENELVHMLENKNNLKLCRYIGHDALPNIKSVLKNSGRLEVFSHFDIGSDELDMSFDVLDLLSNQIKNHQSIKHLSITSYTTDGSDLYLQLAKYANNTAIESLNILVNDKKLDFSDRQLLDHLKEKSLKWLQRWRKNTFDKLTTVGIWVIATPYYRVRSHSNLCFIHKFLSQLKNLKQVNVHSSSHISDVHTVLDYVPQIQTLSIYNMLSKDPKHEMTLLARTIQSTSDRRLNELKPIHLIVNERQHEELEVVVRKILLKFINV